MLLLKHHVILTLAVWQETAYLPSLLKSAPRSPIIMGVAFVLAQIQSGMMEASAI